MIPWLALVLLDDTGDSAGTATADDSCDGNGVCKACMTGNLRQPYWNGESCVSCAVGTGNK